MAKAPGISIEDLSVVFKTRTGVTTALDKVSFDIAPGSFLSVVGPSGCGKTTLLKILSGVLQPSGGRVLFDGEPLARTKVQGQVGYVFQRALLLPWRSALDNVMLTLEVARRGMSRSEREAEARHWLQVAGLAGFEHRFPHELSGGMQQRVSICRALAFRPRILLMDEPFAALDEFTRFKLNDDLMALWQKNRWTVIFVTHSIREAVFLSERVLVMSPRPGRVVCDVHIQLPARRAADLRLSHAFTDQCARVSSHLGAALQERAAS